MIESILRNYRINKTIKRVASVGSNFNWFGSFSFVNPNGIKIGENVNINDGVVVNATKSKVLIGNNVTISSNVQIIAASYDPVKFLNSGSDAKDHVYSEIIIGDNVWICAGVIILPGVKIADHVVIGAGSVVTKSIEEPWCIFAGNPAKLLRRIPHE